MRFKGLYVKFTIGNRPGQRVQEVRVQGEALERDRTYTMLGCEREGDPVTMICRLDHAGQARTHAISIHEVLTQYLGVHSPIAPIIEGRAVATDAPADMLSQVEGTGYRFR